MANGSVNNLSSSFVTFCQQQQGVAPNALLGPHASSILAALNFVESEPSAIKIKREILRIFGTANWLLSPVLFQEFVQSMGEAQFWMIAKTQGVKLERIPEQAHSTPDFRLVGECATAPCFEVKTLSVIEGVHNLKRMDEASFQAQLELSKQKADGKNIAFVFNEVAPHGEVKNGGTHTAIIRNLIDKASNNIKSGQYTSAPTCLVLNLLLIDGHYTGNSNLRPVVPGYPEARSVYSGPLWNLAFGESESWVYAAPEFEGMPGVEGKLCREGVLRANPNIQALLMVIHPLQGKPAIYGLKRKNDDNRWAAELKTLSDAFFDLVEDNWNDDRDTNGWRLDQP